MKLIQRRWTPAEERVLKRKWREGCSGGVIAMTLGRSRSSVMGKVQRMGLLRMIDRKVRETVQDANQKDTTEKASQVGEVIHS